MPKLLTVSSVDVWSGPHAFSFPCSARLYIFSASSSLPWSEKRSPHLCHAHSTPSHSITLSSAIYQHLIPCWIRRRCVIHGLFAFFSGACNATHLSANFASSI